MATSQRFGHRDDPRSRCQLHSDLQGHSSSTTERAASFAYSVDSTGIPARARFIVRRDRATVTERLSIRVRGVTTITAFATREVHVQEPLSRKRTDQLRTSSPLLDELDAIVSRFLGAGTTCFEGLPIARVGLAICTVRLADRCISSTSAETLQNVCQQAGLSRRTNTTARKPSFAESADALRTARAEHRRSLRVRQLVVDASATPHITLSSEALKVRAFANSRLLRRFTTALNRSRTAPSSSVHPPRRARNSQQRWRSAVDGHCV